MCNYNISCFQTSPKARSQENAINLIESQQKAMMRWAKLGNTRIRASLKQAWQNSTNKYGRRQKMTRLAKKSVTKAQRGTKRSDSYLLSKDKTCQRKQGMDQALARICSDKFIGMRTGFNRPNFCAEFHTLISLDKNLCKHLASLEILMI
ncbi:Uncharacterised protein [Helicobacter mustelae]|nr:Uncharacterised protein [Helicobacter mustelae]